MRRILLRVVPRNPKTHKVRILLQAFLNLPGLPPGKQKKIFQEKRTLKPLIPRRDLKGRQILSSCQKPMRRMRVATFRT